MTDGIRDDHPRSSDRPLIAELVENLDELAREPQLGVRSSTVLRARCGHA
jgi:hypothetical protein